MSQVGEQTDPSSGDTETLRARAAREALVGKNVAGRYVLRGLIGHGGMGAVYEAEHLGLGKRVAIKFVDPEYATDEMVVSRFARVRVRAAGEGTTEEEPEEWLVVEWPKNEKAPTKFWLTTLAEDISFERMIDIVMMRWRIERDYQELKQEVGLGHYEGRGWRGFHHHATLCIAAYGFLIAELATIPPSGPRSAAPVQVPPLPDNYRPSGSARAA